MRTSGCLMSCIYEETFAVLLPAGGLPVRAASADCVDRAQYYGNVVRAGVGRSRRGRNELLPLPAGGYEDHEDRNVYAAEYRDHSGVETGPGGYAEDGDSFEVEVRAVSLRCSGGEPE